MALVRDAGITKVTNLALDNLVLELVLLFVFGVGSDQFTVQLGTIGVHTACGRRGDFTTLGKVEVRWREFRLDRCYRGR